MPKFPPVGPCLEYHNVKDYGAVGDGATDDAAAFQAAIDAAGNEVVFIPPGNYVLKSTITIDTFGASLLGSGMMATTLIIDHTAGAGIRIKRSNYTLTNLTVSASIAREGTAVPGNYGIWIEGGDAAGYNVANGTVLKVRINHQPSHALLIVAISQLTVLDQVLVQDNGGHGIVIDSGILTGRVNRGSPGLMTLLNCWALTNGGHGLLGGDVADGDFSLVRLNIQNFEAVDNASNAAVRRSAHQVWLRGFNIGVFTSAFGGGTTTGGAYVDGHDIRLTNCRYVDCIESVEVGSVSMGIIVDGMRVFGAAQNPAVKIHADATRVHVKTETTFNITNLTDRTLTHDIDLEDDRQWAGTLTTGLINTMHDKASLVNLVVNGNFEVGDPPILGWATAFRVTRARENVIVKTGTYSLKGTATVDPGIARVLADALPNFSYYRGRKVTFGCWVYALSTNTDNSRLMITDGIGDSYSANVPKDDTWHWMTITRQVDNGATSLIPQLWVRVSGTATDIAYFDGAILVEGETCPAFSPNPGLAVLTKTTTGDPTGAEEGRMVINTFDNNFKIFAEGVWRTLVTW